MGPKGLQLIKQLTEQTNISKDKIEHIFLGIYNMWVKETNKQDIFFFQFGKALDSLNKEQNSSIVVDTYKYLVKFTKLPKSKIEEILNLLAKIKLKMGHIPFLKLIRMVVLEVDKTTVKENIVETILKETNTTADISVIGLPASYSKQKQNDIKKATSKTNWELLESKLLKEDIIDTKDQSLYVNGLDEIQQGLSKLKYTRLSKTDEKVKMVIRSFEKSIKELDQHVTKKYKPIK